MCFFLHHSRIKNIFFFFSIGLQFSLLIRVFIRDRFGYREITGYNFYSSFLSSKSVSFHFQETICITNYHITHPRSLYVSLPHRHIVQVSFYTL